jgi:hypothetical protein
VNVHRSPSFVALGDTGKSQVAVEYLHEGLRNIEQLRVGGKSNRNGLAKARGFVPGRVKALS